MKTWTLRSSAVVLAFSLAGQAHAQIPVTDVASIAQQMVDYANQGLQYSQLLSQYNQALTDYALQLQNLAALPGTVRNQVQGRLAVQLRSNLNDFGTSYQGSDILFNPNAGSYYGQIEGYLQNLHGSISQPMSSLNSTMAALGLVTNSSNPVWQGAYTNRLKYEGMLDSLRANSLMRSNAADRSNEANNIATQMAVLPANNTVGAIQLLAAQNSLGYAQQEEFLKQQAIANRLQQQQQVEMLINQDAALQRRLDSRAKTLTHTAVPVLPF